MKSLIELTKETGRQNVISFGINMKCKRVVTKSVLVYENGRFHEENGGIKIKVRDEHLNEYYLDTKENRKFLNLTK